MPIFKFGLQSDTISFKLPSLRFYAFGEGFGEEGDCEFIVPSQDFVCIGEGHGNFALPIVSINSKGAEIAECEFLLPWTKILCDGDVAIHGIGEFDIPCVKIVCEEAAECVFNIPVTKLRGVGSAITHGDCIFNLPCITLSGELEHGQSCSINCVIPVIVFTAYAYISVVGECWFSLKVPTIKCTGIMQSVPKSPDTDVVLRYEDSRRLI